MDDDNLLAPTLVLKFVPEVFPAPGVVESDCSLRSRSILMDSDT